MSKIKAEHLFVAAAFLIGIILVLLIDSSSSNTITIQNLGEMHYIFFITLCIVTTMLAILAIMLPFLITMHNILYPILDPDLFKEPYFNPQQLVMFNNWPMSFIKTVIYMFLISYPNFIRKRKRFKTLKEVPQVSTPIRFACKMYTQLHLLFVFTGTTFLGLLTAFYFTS